MYLNLGYCGLQKISDTFTKSWKLFRQYTLPQTCYILNELLCFINWKQSDSELSFSYLNRAYNVFTNQLHLKNRPCSPCYPNTGDNSLNAFKDILSQVYLFVQTTKWNLTHRLSPLFFFHLKTIIKIRSYHFSGTVFTYLWWFRRTKDRHALSLIYCYFKFFKNLFKIMNETLFTLVWTYPKGN